MHNAWHTIRLPSRLASRCFNPVRSVYWLDELSLLRENSVPLVALSFQREQIHSCSTGHPPREVPPSDNHRRIDAYTFQDGMPWLLPREGQEP